MSTKTVGHSAIAGFRVQDSALVSFEEIGADLHALYSGNTSTINLDTLAVDVHALYADMDIPISRNDLLAELFELYGNDDVSWADFSVDFHALYTAHAV